MGKTQRVLKAWRKRGGLTQKQAARKLGCHQSQVSQWEAGYCEPGERWTKRIHEVCQ